VPPILVTAFGKRQHQKVTQDLLRKVNLGTVQLGLKVIRIPGQKNESSTQHPNKDGGSLILGGSNRVDISILTNDLDPSHKVAPTVIGGGGNSTQSTLTLGSSLVEGFTPFLDLIGIGCIIFIILISILGFLAGHALSSDHGGGSVGEESSRGEGGVGSGTVARVGKDGTGIIGEETHADGGSVVGAVRAHEVLNLLGIVVVVVVIIVVVVVLLFKLPTLSHLIKILLLLLLGPFLGIGVPIRTVLHALVQEAIVLAHFLTVVLVVVVIVAGTLVLGGILAVVLSVLLDGLKVGSEVGIHVNHVVTVSLLAAVGIVVRAGTGGAETEADKGHVGHADIIVVVNLLVPFGEVVTSLEFDGVIGYPGVVNFAIVILLESTVNAAGAGEEFLTEGGVGGDVFGGGESDDGEEGAEGELHCSILARRGLTYYYRRINYGSWR